MPEHSSVVVSVSSMGQIRYLNSSSWFSPQLIPLYHLCTQHLQNWQRVKLLSTPFLQIAQVKFSSLQTFPAFPLLIIVSIFLIFIAGPFDSSNFSKPLVSLFKPSSDSLSNPKSSASINPSGHKVVSLKSFSNLWGNSYTMFLVLDIKYHFTCGKWNLY